MTRKGLLFALLSLLTLALGSLEVAARPAEPGRAAAHPISVIPINEQVYVVDLPNMGVRPLDHPLPLDQRSANPLGLPRLLAPR